MASYGVNEVGTGAGEQVDLNWYSSALFSTVTIMKNGYCLEIYNV